MREHPGKPGSGRSEGHGRTLNQERTLRHAMASRPLKPYVSLDSAVIIIPVGQYTNYLQTSKLQSNSASSVVDDATFYMCAPTGTSALSSITVMAQSICERCNTATRRKTSNG
jgi:hypothetical protein